jgi:hypothetical protein
MIEMAEDDGDDDVDTVRCLLFGYSWILRVPSLSAELS